MNSACLNKTENSYNISVVNVFLNFVQCQLIVRKYYDVYVYLFEMLQLFNNPRTEIINEIRKTK